MHKFVPLALILGAVAASAAELADLADPSVDELDPRFLFVNSTGSLLPINAAALVGGLGFLVVLTLLGIGIWLLVSTLVPNLNRTHGGGYDDGYGHSGYGGYSGGSSYAGYQASVMYRPQALAAGLLVQLLAAATARVDAGGGPAGAASARADLTHLTAVQPAAVSGGYAPFLPASGAYVARPPTNPAAYTAYPPYGQYPYTAYSYPYPYPADIDGHATVDTASGDTSRLFGNVASALNPTNLFSCRGGDAGCVVQKIVAGFLIMGAVGLAAYLVYALMNGTLGGLSLGRSADPYSAIWDKMSVLDWIAMLEELYRKFDATSMDCQKRLVCELHQNENTWGSTARKMNNAFSYLQYLELLNLPTDLSMLVDDYLDAANKGRTSQQTCENMYTDCEFSVKALLSKYNGSNAI